MSILPQFKKTTCYCFAHLFTLSSIQKCPHEARSGAGVELKEETLVPVPLGFLLSPSRCLFQDVMQLESHSIPF